MGAATRGELYHSNVDGTRNLLEAARRAGVERVVYTSTVGCIGVPHGGIGDEDRAGVARRHGRAITSARSSWPSRWRSSSPAPGLPVVIVNPTAPVGDHDVKPTPTGKIVLDFLNGAMPAFIDTGLNVVDVARHRARATAGLRARAAGRALHPGLART